LRPFSWLKRGSCIIPDNPLQGEGGVGRRRGKTVALSCKQEKKKGEKMLFHKPYTRKNEGRNGSSWLSIFKT